AVGGKKSRRRSASVCASASALDTRPDGFYLEILNLTAWLRLRRRSANKIKSLAETRAFL
ncbi:MAG: hypothetical protein ACLQVW_04095, partial [Limisphaerales bacterium]